MQERESKSVGPSRRGDGRRAWGRRVWLALAAVAGLAILVPAAGIAAGPPNGNSPETLSASDLFVDRPTGDYVIGVEDKLRIRVFEMKDLSSDDEVVDANGEIELPLIGDVTAAGLTVNQLEKEIAKRLGDRYLQSPQVSVAVTESASQKVTVEGEVKAPGVFILKGRTTLMQAISMAGGPDPSADTRKVAVIRVVGGVRKVAICDYRAITKGLAPDPLIQGDDTLVMNGSAVRTAWNTVLQSLPAFSLLAYLR